MRISRKLGLSSASRARVNFASREYTRRRSSTSFTPRGRRARRHMPWVAWAMLATPAPGHLRCFLGAPGLFEHPERRQRRGGCIAAPRRWLRVTPLRCLENAQNVGPAVWCGSTARPARNSPARRPNGWRGSGGVERLCRLLVTRSSARGPPRADQYSLVIASRRNGPSGHLRGGAAKIRNHGRQVSQPKVHRSQYAGEHFDALVAGRRDQPGITSWDPA